MVTKDMVEQMLLQVHTAFVGKILSVSGNSAKVQPLSMIKQMDGRAIKPAVLSDVPICGNVRHVSSKTITVEGTSFEVPVLTNPVAGDVVLCLCADRDSSVTRRGNFAEPSWGHHSLSDAFIVGLIGG